MDQTLVSIVLPAFNEGKIIKNSLKLLNEYLVGLGNDFFWEIIVINDGSTDETGKIADEMSHEISNLRVIHHKTNMNLGTAMKTGFAKASGTYIIVMDLDLSYAPNHIKKLLDKIIETDADIVVASPYVKGGKVSNVPLFRRIMSRFVNWLMSLFAQTRIHTFTGMVRAYKQDFLNGLNLKGTSQVINPEIIYKAIILRARIEEIPAHLDWSFSKKFEKKRRPSIKLVAGVLKGLMSAFIFRPYAFFFLIGILLFIAALYIIVWIFINVMTVYPDVIVTEDFFDARFSAAVSEVFRRRPHSFIVGGITLIVSLQFISMGFLSLQNKRNFEENFHINSSILRQLKKFDSNSKTKRNHTIKDDNA